MSPTSTSSSVGWPPTPPTGSRGSWRNATALTVGALAAAASARPARCTARREAFEQGFGDPVMRSMPNIAVDGAGGVGSFDDAVRYLREGQLVGISPGAPISRSFELKEFKT